MPVSSRTRARIAVTPRLRGSGQPCGARNGCDARTVVASLRMEAAKDPDDSRQRLMILTAEPGTPSHERLRILASWYAEPHPSPGAERLPVKATDA